MRITYDPLADAVYVKLGEATANVGQTTVTEQGVIVDVDASGKPRGFEFLCVQSKGLPLGGLPRPIARAIKSFVASGALDADTKVEQDYP